MYTTFNQIKILQQLNKNPKIIINIGVILDLVSYILVVFSHSVHKNVIIMIHFNSQCV